MCSHCPWPVLLSPNETLYPSLCLFDVLILLPGQKEREKERERKKKQKKRRKERGLSERHLRNRNLVFQHEAFVESVVSGRSAQRIHNCCNMASYVHVHLCTCKEGLWMASREDNKFFTWHWELWVLMCVDVLSYSSGLIDAISWHTWCFSALVSRHLCLLLVLVWIKTESSKQQIYSSVSRSFFGVTVSFTPSTYQWISGLNCGNSWTVCARRHSWCFILLYTWKVTEVVVWRMKSWQDLNGLRSLLLSNVICTNECHNMNAFEERPLLS